MSDKPKLTQHEKELKSLKNKLKGHDLYWFNSLSLTKQYDILFMWKKTKFNSISKTRTIKRIFLGKKIDVKIYPAKFKHFIQDVKTLKHFRISKYKLRNTILNDLIK